MRIKHDIISNMPDKKGWARFVDWCEGVLAAHNLLMYVLIYCFYISVKLNNAACITATGTVLCGAFGIRTYHGVKTYQIDADSDASDDTPDKPDEVKKIAEPEPTTGESQ